MRPSSPQDWLCWWVRLSPQQAFPDVPLLQGWLSCPSLPEPSNLPGASHPRLLCPLALSSTLMGPGGVRPDPQELHWTPPTGRGLGEVRRVSDHTVLGCTVGPALLIRRGTGIYRQQIPLTQGCPRMPTNRVYCHQKKLRPQVDAFYKTLLACSPVQISQSTGPRPAPAVA